MTLWLMASTLMLTAPPAAAIPVGNGRFEAEVGSQRIEVFTYRPAGFRDGPLLVVCHGVLRNAEEYRDHARKLADRLDMLIAAPRFDRERFPSERYQRGGLLVNGRLAPREEWTWSAVPKIVEAVRRRERRPDMPYYLIGHSAGAQFAQRLAAFVPHGAQRVVVANAGVHLFPTREMPFSFGFGELPHEISSDEHLRRYLAQPLTIYLGGGDTLRDDELYVSQQADEQGTNRHERGQYCFEMGQRLARERGWQFNWRQVIAPGVGHDHQAMFDAPECETALFGQRRSQAKRNERP
jgi:pimeloyl-ACP methyl ester carboxylesterase